MFFDFGNLNPPEPRFFWKYGMYPQSHGLASCSLLQLVLWGYIPFPGIPIPHSSLVKSMCLILKSLKSIKLLEESPKGHQHPFHRKPPQSIWFRGLGFPTNFPNQPSPNPPSHVSLPPHPAPPHCGASAAAAAPAPARRAPAASASSAPSRHASVAAAGAAAAWSKGPSPRGDTEHWLGFGEKNMEKIRLLYDELRSMIFNNGHIIYCNRHIFCLVGNSKNRDWTIKHMDWTIFRGILHGYTMGINGCMTNKNDIWCGCSFLFSETYGFTWFTSHFNGGVLG